MGELNQDSEVPRGKTLGPIVVDVESFDGDEVSKENQGKIKEYTMADNVIEEKSLILANDSIDGIVTIEMKQNVSQLLDNQRRNLGDLNLNTTYNFSNN